MKFRFRNYIWVVYVCKETFKGFLMAMGGLLALFTLLEFITRLGQVGMGSYTIYDDMYQSILTLPSRFNQMAPMGMLLGAMLGLGKLAAKQELVALMATGIFAWRVITAASLLIIPVTLGLLLSSQYILPTTQYYVQQIQYKADPPNIAKEAVWEHQGDSFLRVGQLGPRELHDGYHSLYGIEYFKFHDGTMLETFIKARSAELMPHGKWILHDVFIKQKNAHHFDTIHKEIMDWNYPISYGRLLTLSQPAQDLSATALIRAVLDARRHGDRNPMCEQELWDRAMIPVTMLALLFCTVPFLFGVSRGRSIGARIGSGVLIAVIYTLGQEIIERTAFVSNLNPMFGAILPPLILTILAVHFYIKTVDT